MSAFRNELGGALERIARLEEENQWLRAELDRLQRASPAKRSSEAKAARGLSLDAAFLGVVMIAGVLCALANMHLGVVAGP